MTDKMENEQGIICPVCRGLLREQLPSMEGVLGGLFWDTERIRIATSEMVIECDFDHERDEENENFPLETSFLYPQRRYAKDDFIYKYMELSTLGVLSFLLHV